MILSFLIMSFEDYGYDDEYDEDEDDDYWDEDHTSTLSIFWPSFAATLTAISDPSL